VHLEQEPLSLKHRSLLQRQRALFALQVRVANASPPKILCAPAPSRTISPHTIPHPSSTCLTLRSL